MEISGTAMMALESPCRSTLSRARNMRARDLPDAGGALSSKY